MSNLEQNTTPVDGSTEENGSTIEHSVTTETVCKTIQKNHLQVIVMN